MRLPFGVRLPLTTAFVAVLSAGCGDDTAERQESEEDVRSPKVLLIGIDGVRPDILASVATPNIDALIGDGAFSAEAQTGLPTVSGPSWSSMLTGVWSDKHGVVDNTFEGKNYGPYPDFLTRLETERPELGTYAIADWAPLVSELDGGPLIGSVPDEVVMLNGYDLGWREADAMSVDIAVDRLARPDVDALFVYLGNPDETSHAAGSIGTEYRDAIAMADSDVGQLVDALEARPSFASERWLILVSTDHGRSENGGHGGESVEERTIFYIASGPDAESGTIEGTPQIVDVAVTALVHMGVEIDPAWGLDGIARGLRR